MINLKNFMLALKSTWIRRLTVNTSKYVSIFETMYTKINDFINRGPEFTKRLIRNKSNIFWHDVLNSWIEICNKQNETKSEEIGSINIWNNKDITIANNSFFYRRWYEKNIYSLATQPTATLHIKPTNIISPFIQLVINKRDERLQVNERIVWHSPINHNRSN